MVAAAVAVRVMVLMVRQVVAGAVRQLVLVEREFRAKETMVAQVVAALVRVAAAVRAGQVPQAQRTQAVRAVPQAATPTPGAPSRTRAAAAAVELLAAQLVRTQAREVLIRPEQPEPLTVAAAAAEAAVIRQAATAAPVRSSSATSLRTRPGLRSALLVPTPQARTAPTLTIRTRQPEHWWCRNGTFCVSR
jgi:hypothetical protein